VIFFSICPCPNCREDVWRRDEFEAYRTKGYVKRYSCFKCGEDLYLNRIPPTRVLEIA
jgi:hypothetical protein